LLELDKWASLW
nr:Chain C, gp41 peptide LLELDKWASLW [synthetic construct]